MSRNTLCYFACFVVFVCFCLLVQFSKVVFPVYLKGLFLKIERNMSTDSSSFNRSGIEPSPSSITSSSSQAPHHMMRASARENPKSASLSAQQQTPKIQEKLKCVLHFLL